MAPDGRPPLEVVPGVAPTSCGIHLCGPAPELVDRSQGGAIEEGGEVVGVVAERPCQRKPGRSSLPH